MVGIMVRDVEEIEIFKDKRPGETRESKVDLFEAGVPADRCEVGEVSGVAHVVVSVDVEAVPGSVASAEVDIGQVVGMSQDGHGGFQGKDDPNKGGKVPVFRGFGAVSVLGGVDSDVGDEAWRFLIPLPVFEDLE